MTRSPGDGAVADTHKPNSQQYLKDPETGRFLPEEHTEVAEKSVHALRLMRNCFCITR